MMAWGMNRKGQLGMGDYDTRQTPTLVTGAVPGIIRVFASAHSSAAIDGTGKLYTWGSGSHHRTMHEDDEPKMLPTLVEYMSTMVVRTFAFANEMSGALVVTQLDDVRPHVIR